MNPCPQIIFTLFIQLKTPGEGVLPIAFRVGLFASGKSFPQMKRKLGPVNLDPSKLATKIKHHGELVFYFMIQIITEGHWKYNKNKFKTTVLLK